MTFGDKVLTDINKVLTDVDVFPGLLVVFGPGHGSEPRGRGFPGQVGVPASVNEYTI